MEVHFNTVSAVGKENDLNRQQNETITALYCRFSQDDGKKDCDSDSIQNQKEYLMDYAKRNRFPNPQFYVDDGYTGTNFDRPAFIRMNEDCEKGLVGTVIVKDLSRFGREHIGVGRYQEIIYPESRIRFIAVMDNVDTQSEDSNEFSAFTNLFNEWYPKTTSKKVKQVKRTKAMNGEHLGQAPFGYLKNPDNPKRWLIDKEAAPVVRRIFQMAMEGCGCSAIATALWRDRVLTPSAYKASKGIGVARQSEDPYCWEPSAVGAILDNPAYIGVTESLKTTRLSFKSKKRVPSPVERRAIIEDAHEPVIDRLVWDKVALLRKNKRRPAKSGETSIFSGLLYCADCGSKLSLNLSNGYRYFRCAGYKRNSRSKACTIHYIRESVLEELVLKQLRYFLSYLQQFERAFVKRQIDSSIADREYELYQKQKRIEQLENRSKEIDRLFRKTYEDNAAGKITDRQFFTLSEGYEAEQREVEEEATRLTEELKSAGTEVSNVEKLIAVTRKYTRIEELTAEILNAFVDRIVVHEAEKKGGKRSQSIDIYYSYVGIVNIPTQEELEEGCAGRYGRQTA